MRQLPDKREHGGHGQGGPHHGGHRRRQLLFPAGTEQLGHHNGRSHGKPNEQRVDKMEDRRGYPHPGQRSRPHRAAHDHRVHQVIGRLKHIAQQQRQGQRHDLPPGRPLRQIPDHAKRLPSLPRGRSAAPIIQSYYSERTSLRQTQRQPRYLQNCLHENKCFLIYGFGTSRVSVDFHCNCFLMSVFGEFNAFSSVRFANLRNIAFYLLFMLQ